jgi:hypothetical protein
LELPAWFAAITQVPVPVIVNVLPETEHGPEDQLKLTASPELVEADRAIGETPSLTGDEGAVKAMACDAWVTVSVPVPEANAKSAFPL